MTAAAVTVCGASLLLGPASGAAVRASASTIQVGAIADEQTPCEEAGTGQIAPDTLRAWQSYVNKHGGITGHPVQLTILNSKCDPGVSLSDANQLAAQHVIAVIDATSEDSSIAAPLDAAKIPVLCGAPSANDLYCSTDANFFPSGSTELATVYGTVFASHKAGLKTFGFLYCTEVATCQQAVPFFGALTKEVGMGYASVAASETAPNYLAQCLVMQNAHVDALFVGGPPADQVARSCAQQGYHPIYPQNVGTWTTRYLPNPNFQGATGPTGNIPWNIRSPQTKVFHAAEDKVLAGALYPYNVSATYAAGLLLQTALAHASSNLTSQDVYTGLYALSGSTLGGFAPQLKYVQGKPTTVSCFFLVSIKKSHWVAPYGSNTFCQPAS